MTQSSVAVLSIRDALASVAAELAAAGIDRPQVQARVLVGHALARPPFDLPPDGQIDPPAAARLALLAARRAAREPLQHLLGTAPFRYRELAVGPGVFIPRPETELLVELVTPFLLPGVTVVDLCSGSGALALAIADEHPGCQVLAVENAPAALGWLRRNAAGTDVVVVDGDVRSLRAGIGSRVVADVVVANPPYVALGTAVSEEVRAETPEAVFAGPDGLATIPAVIAAAAELLRPGGRLAVEHGESQAGAVRALVAEHGGFADVTTERDLTGRDRFVAARRNG